MDFAYSIRTAEDRSRLNEVVVKSNVVFQRPHKVLGLN